ncbi:MAG: site-2 protease family protein [Planctomycetales bacterium]|nr:site-2 protease family protein [Planctomycetales bacterium]
MHHLDVWSLSLGRWRGVQVKLHMFFLLFATFTCYLAWRMPADGAADDSFAWTAALCILVLFLSVLLHELGHVLAARRFNGAVDGIVIGPLGGLQPIRIPNDPQSELLVALAGPLVSAGITAICLMALLFSGEPHAYRVLHPFSPEAFEIATSPGGMLGPKDIVGLICWINWLLLLINLIPAFPFDGGRVCLAFLQTMRPQLAHHHAVVLVAALAKIVAVGLLIAAFFFRDSQAASVAPTWLALILLAIFVFFSARVEEEHPDQEESESGPFGYDFSQGFTSLEQTTEPPSPPPPGPLTRWWRKWQQRRELKRRRAEAEEDERLDEVLQRLHEFGESALSPAERALLKRVSARYRDRDVR